MIKKDKVLLTVPIIAVCLRILKEVLVDGVGKARLLGRATPSFRVPVFFLGKQELAFS